jgi:3-methyladenine DNA glycosylase AlkD
MPRHNKLERSYVVTVNQILNDLKAMADPRAVGVWKRMGMDTSTFYGVGLTKIKDYSKKVGRNHQLAAELWATEIHDARLLAVMIEEPGKVAEEQIDRWIAEADFWDLSDKICTTIMPKTPFALKKMRKWVKSKDEFVKRSGFRLMAELARGRNAIEDSELEESIALIERTIHRQKNWVREAMNWALISIGSRNKSLNEQALAAARRIGKVHVDYGETSCKLPDAEAYLSGARLQARRK